MISQAKELKLSSKATSSWHKKSRECDVDIDVDILSTAHSHAHTQLRSVQLLIRTRSAASKIEFFAVTRSSTSWKLSWLLSWVDSMWISYNFIKKTLRHALL